MSSGNLVDTITVSDTMEISFNLQLFDSCPFSNRCRLMRIWNDDANLLKLPFLNIPPTGYNLRVVYSENVDSNAAYDIYSNSLLNTFEDGNYHNYYFRFSPTERIFIYDDITLYNIVNGQYDSSLWTNKQYGLWLVDETGSLCIYCFL